MTREEAIFYIKELQKTYASMDKKVAESVDMAIEALSQPIVAKHFDIQSGYIYCSPQIAENIKVVVRCKDCIHRQTDECLMYYEEWYEIDEGDGYADTDFIIHDYTRDDGFCHHGERREPCD